MVISVSYRIINNSGIYIPELFLMQCVSESKYILVRCKIGARDLAPEPGIFFHELFIKAFQGKVLSNTGLHPVNIAGYKIG